LAFFLWGDDEEEADLDWNLVEAFFVPVFLFLEVFGVLPEWTDSLTLPRSFHRLSAIPFSSDSNLGSNRSSW
jgi:hypothetical protein